MIYTSYNAIGTFMKRILLSCIALLTLLMQQTYASNSGLLFNVVAGGTPANLTISLCLNGKGALSCQQYAVSGLNLRVSTTIPNHTYPAAGIKILTPNFVPAGCTPAPNGYCLFSVSNTSPASFTIQPTTVVSYWVSPSGSDSANGDVNHPFLTIGHAQEVVRANPLRSIQPIVVNIRGGLYRLTSPLTFNQSDSGSINAGVTYIAAPGENTCHFRVRTGYRMDIVIWLNMASSSHSKHIYDAKTVIRQWHRATRARSPAISSPSTPNYPNYYTPTATDTRITIPVVQIRKFLRPGITPPLSKSSPLRNGK